MLYTNFVELYIKQSDFSLSSPYGAGLGVQILVAFQEC